MTVTAALADASSFRDVAIVPFSDLMDEPFGGSFHRGGPCWPDFADQVTARHCRGGRPIDVEPATPEGPLDDIGTIAWGGPLVKHYGHEVAEFLTRLLPTLSERPDLQVAFASSERLGMRSLADAPAFFGALLEWYGLPPDRRLFIDTPVRAREVVVYPQVEQINGPGPSEETLDALDALTNARLGPADGSGGTIYVSRAGLRTRFAGEGYLEQALGEAGVGVVRPETRPIPEQIAVYRAAKRLIFAEGSAIHTMQLSGRFAADVDVLIRRPGKRLAEASIAPRVPSVTFSDVTRGLVHGLRPSGDPAMAIGISILDEEALLQEVARNGIDVRKHWSQREYQAERDRDVSMWLETEAKTARARVPGAAAAIARTLTDAGLAEFAVQVPDVLAGERVRPVGRRHRWLAAIRRR